MKMNLRPSLRFQLWDMAKCCLGFVATIAVLVAVVPAAALLINGRPVEVNVSGYGGMAAICLFVVGIVAPRGYLRLDSQMGVSRATSFTALLITVLTVSLALSLLGELMTAAAQALYRRLPGYTFFDLYQMLYLEGGRMSLGDRLLSVCLNTALDICCYTGGMFFTLLFWRLSKLWSIVAAVALVLLLNLGISSVALPRVAWVSDMLRAFADAASASPLPLIVLFIVLSAILALVEWLLLRRAYIRAPA